ncbi:MAG: hypothetical protein FJ038_08725 [Chloroflexi bacterium]|nr:hypothetical protein [Chloroflexota bacterium]
MAVRLHLKLGLVPEADRLSDSPDAMVVVEPNIGSITRTKGNLYLLVTSRTGGSRVAEATELVAETIRTEYYYDESAGIRVCIRKAIQLANKRLGHHRDRLGMSDDPRVQGPIGIALAVVRANELYVATVGPAEAYLIRQARMSTLPDPHRERGLPSGELEPEIWRGEISIGDSLVLISRNVVARLGPDELKEAMLTLHPQSAIEHVHHRFITAGGVGSDGAVAFEATEVPITSRSRTLVPVRPPEPLAGAPDRSPIPLADSVSDGMAALGSGAGRARNAAGGAFTGLIDRLLDLLPRRRPKPRRVNPVAARRESQRRAALALLAFVALVSVLGLGVYFFGGARPAERLDSITAAQRALERIRANVAQVFGAGVDLVRDDEQKALRLLTDALAQISQAKSAGVPEETLVPLRRQVVGGLDRIYRMVTVASRTLINFGGTVANANLTDLVQGPDGAPFVLDRGTNAVYRIDPKTRKASEILRNGQAIGDTKAAAPRMLAVGGRDLLILDAKNVFWRWRPVDARGDGTLAKVAVPGSSSWGTDIRAIGTYIRSAEQGLYNLYVVDPSEQQILRYSPAADGSGYPAAPSGFLATAQDLDTVEGMHIDGDVYVAADGELRRFVGGQSGGWEAEPPRDELLRPAPRYVDVTSTGERGAGLLYAYDKSNARVIAIDKATGEYREQFRVTLAPGWRDMRGMYVTPGGEDDPATITWIDSKRVYTSVLAPIPTAPGASPAASPGSSAGRSPTASGGTPRPTPTPEASTDSAAAQP